MSRCAACLLRRVGAIRRALRDITPINADCGRLCGKACCTDRSDEEGGDEEYGMLLLPGEELYYRGLKGFRAEKLAQPGSSIWFLTCTEPCSRNKRPAACRMFPILPCLRGAKLKAEPDARGAFICPLIQNGENHCTPEFRRAVLAAFEPHLECRKIRRWLEQLTRTADDYSRFISG